MMKRVWQAVRHYYLFSIALVASLLAIALQIANADTALRWVLIITASYELLPLLWGMVQDLRHGKYGVDILAATAIATSVLFGEYWAGIVLVLMLTGGEALEDYAEHRAERELDALLTRAPQKARLIRDGKQIEVKASEVRAGDSIAIRPGELVPVDAVVTDGMASFDESSLTGESLPQPKNPGEELLSGSINLDGSITAKALRSAADSQYQQIVKLVTAAQSSRAPFVRLADRYAVPFTIVSFAIASLAWILSGQSIRFLEVIVVATPCPLILAAPIAIISGMSRSAKHGIIIKNGSSLERLAQTRTVAFDKTGTLTRGELTVAHLTTYDSFTKREALTAAATLEHHSNHVQARAIVAHAHDNGYAPKPVKQLREIAGKGVVGMMGGKQIIVGRLELLQEQGVQLPPNFRPETQERSAAFIAISQKLAGVITFTDTIRQESKATLASLRALGIKDFLMVTGDTAQAAKRVGEDLGISHIVAGALPADKIRAVEHVNHKPVAFVGDGVNDAPVLTASDVGIALGARGSAAASESADVVILLDDLERVSRAIAIAKHTFRIARQSIWVGIGMSVALMLIFATGRFKPVYGAAIQELVDVVVIFNALRAHGGHAPKQSQS